MGENTAFWTHFQLEINSSWVNKPPDMTLILQKLKSQTWTVNTWISRNWMRGKRLKNCIELIFLYKLADSVSSNLSNKCKTMIGVLYLKLQKLMESDECISWLVYLKKYCKWRLQVRRVLLSNVGYVGKESVGCL